MFSSASELAAKLRAARYVIDLVAMEVRITEGQVIGKLDEPLQSCT